MNQVLAYFDFFTSSRPKAKLYILDRCSKRSKIIEKAGVQYIYIVYTQTVHSNNRGRVFSPQQMGFNLLNPI